MDTSGKLWWPFGGWDLLLKLQAYLCCAKDGSENAVEEQRKVEFNTQ